jgi:hypothetical protein
MEVSPYDIETKSRASAMFPLFGRGRNSKPRPCNVF